MHVGLHVGMPYSVQYMHACMKPFIFIHARLDAWHPTDKRNHLHVCMHVWTHFNFIVLAMLMNASQVGNLCSVNYLTMYV